MRGVLLRSAGCAVAVATVLTLSGCWSSDNEILYEGPRDELVDACGRAAMASPLTGNEPGRQVVENVTVFDADARYPIVFGELEIQHWGDGGDSRFQWMCEIPAGDDYLAAEITTLVAID
jgi:hypothetical protein